MLVLARKLNQSIVIGDNVEIQVVEIRGDQVKLGITAPRSVTVHRKEVYEEIQSANKEALSQAKNVNLQKIPKVFLKRKSEKDSTK